MSKQPDQAGSVLPAATRPKGRLRRYAVYGALVLLGGVVVIDGIFSLLATAGSVLQHDLTSSDTSTEAKRKGSFVTALRPEPAVLDWHGQPVAIDEAWVEHRMDHPFAVLVVIPGAVQYPLCRQLPGYYVALTLKPGPYAFTADRDLFFVMPGSEAGFGQSWSRGRLTVTWHEVPDPPAGPFKIMLTDSFKLDDARELVLTPTK